MAYAQQTWVDGSGGGTPITSNGTNSLNHMEAGIGVADTHATQALGQLGLPLDLTGATAATRFVGATASGHPTSGGFLVGDFVVDQSGTFWICNGSGSPGTWIQNSTSGTVNLTGYSKALITNAAAGGAANLDLTATRCFLLTLTAPTCALSIVNVPTVTNAVLEILVALKQDATGGRASTWPGNVSWGDNGAAPNVLGTPNSTDIYLLTSTDSGATWQARSFAGLPPEPSAALDGLPLSWSKTTQTFIEAKSATPAQMFQGSSVTIPSGVATNVAVGSQFPPLAAVIPASGVLRITIGGTIINQTSTSSTIHLSWQATGAASLGPGDLAGIETQGTSNILTASRTYIWNGLTPGGTITFTPVYSVSSSDGSSAIISNGTLFVEPL